MSKNISMSSLLINHKQSQAKTLKRGVKKRTRVVYSFADLVQKLFEKEHEIR